MVERPELTRYILEYFARDDVGFPADKYISDLQAAFPDEDPDTLSYHVWCAGDADLLLVNMTMTHGLDGVRIGAGVLTGLTASGQGWPGALLGSRSEGHEESVSSAGLPCWLFGF